MKVAVLFFSFVLTAAAKQTTEGPKEFEFLFRAETLGIVSSSQLEKLLRLSSETESETGEAREGEKFPDFQGDAVQDAERGVFMRMYNRLTLLNVLYISGALLVMGAYGLFMTLAVKHCTMRELSLIMIGKTLALGVAGLLLWTTDYQFLGGM